MSDPTDEQRERARVVHDTIANTGDGCLACWEASAVQAARADEPCPWCTIIAQALADAHRAGVQAGRVESWNSSWSDAHAAGRAEAWAEADLCIAGLVHSCEGNAVALADDTWATAARWIRREITPEAARQIREVMAERDGGGE